MKKLFCLFFVVTLLIFNFLGCEQPKYENIITSAPLATHTTQAERMPTLPTTPSKTPFTTANASAYEDLPALGIAREWNYDDGGLDGIGVIIGNTNGNIRNGGLAVLSSDKLHAFYWVGGADSYSEEPHILDFNWGGGKITLIFESSNNQIDYPFLNCLGKKLWFVNKNTVYAYDPESEELEIILALDMEEVKIYRLFAGYGYLFIDAYFVRETISKTLCFDIASGRLTHFLNGFSLSSLMNGRLYGTLVEADGNRHVVSMTPDGRNMQASYEGSLAADGMLYEWNVGEGEYPEDGSITVTDMKTGASNQLNLPNDFFCYELVNVSHEYIYVKDWYADDYGYVYAIRIRDMKWMGKISDFLYYYEGFAILDGRPEWELIPYQRGTKADEIYE